jgi:hypothetical protein
MAIWYINPTTGNNANDGVAWGSAWASHAGATATKGVVVGDTIKFAKSPDPVSVGTATWTNRKLGNSVTFDSTVGTTVDLCDSGWVAGTGVTVTNGQTTNYITETTFGSNNGKALQLATAAITNVQMAYKNITSTNFSGNTNLCFWIRFSSQVDLTGTNNVTLNLHQTTGGGSSFNVGTIPKFIYYANTWYPVVISTSTWTGGLAPTGIQSISLNYSGASLTTNIYVDEIFMTSNGLTLHSLLGDNDGGWYPIKAVRDADVQLMGPMLATAATCMNNANQIADAWTGTTANFTTYRRECIKSYAGISTYPVAAAIWGTSLFSGVWNTTTKSLVNFSYGWDPATNIQNGYTYVDNLVQNGSGFNTSFSNYSLDRVCFVRFGTGFAPTTPCEIDNIGAIACSTTSIALNGTTVWPVAGLLDTHKTINFLSSSSNATPLAIVALSTNQAFGYTINFGKMLFGGISTFIGGGLLNSTFNIGTLSSSTLTTIAVLSGGNSTIPSYNTYNITDLSSCTGLRTTATYLTGTIGIGDVVNIGSAYPSQGSTGGAVITAPSGVGQSTIYNIGSVIGSGAIIAGGAGNAAIAQSNLIVKVGSMGSATLTNTFGLTVGDKLTLPDYNGAGFPKIIYCTATGTTFASFDLQVGDVHTAGNKAWKYTPAASSNTGIISALKLGSAAAVANKLVTVTCYVKCATADANQRTGLRIPAVLLPGYTVSPGAYYTLTDVTWQQLTITFTPTSDCVFDIEAYAQYFSPSVTGAAVWDDLVVTQAA